MTKRLAPGQPGALRWTRQYGKALVCVRYRRDEQGQRRYTTIELVVDEAPILSRNRPDEIVHVRIAFEESSLRQLARDHGAQWNPALRLWAMPKGTAKTLQLLPRVVKI